MDRGGRIAGRPAPGRAPPPRGRGPHRAAPRVADRRRRDLHPARPAHALPRRARTGPRSSRSPPPCPPHARYERPLPPSCRTLAPVSLPAISRDLAAAADKLRFAAPVTHVYDPLVYARAPHEAYLERFGRGPKEVLFLG